MIAANQTVFRLLSDHSVRHGNPVQSPEKIRFIASTGRDKEYLKNLKIGQSIRFGRHRSLSSLSINQDRLVGLVGFDFEPDLPELTYIGGDAGTSVALISEMQPHPIASPAQIRNIVEAGDKSVEGYTGHRIADVAPLFPPIQIWQTNREDSSDSIWQLFLSVCVHECQRGGSWIEGALADELTALAQLGIPLLPYRSLCHSIFDMDPRSLYMSLYRCIEATYAYESCRRLVDRLSLNFDWHLLAQALDAEVGWHPKESNSLNQSLKYALEQDLADICALLGVKEGSNVAAAAGTAIYRLRNRIVHFRPGIDEVGVDEYDWNSICLHLVRIVLNVFSQAYAYQA